MSWALTAPAGRITMGPRMSELISMAPPDAVKILLTLFLCFLIGLEREDRAASAPYTFGGVRTFPLIGLLGYALALLSPLSPIALAAGLLAVGALLLLSFHHKLQTRAGAGVTTEVSALLTYALGALIQRDFYWIAATLVVLALLLLELKQALESLSRRVAGDEILSFTKFLLLAAVILPAVPNQDFTQFHLNPYKTWLVVVAVSGVSYGSYALQRLVKGRGGVLTAAILGGAYSSTVATVTLAKKSRGAARPHLYAGSILMASGVMYVRLLGLLWIFNAGMFRRLGPFFAALAAAGLAFGAWWARRADPGGGAAQSDAAPKNPLELDAAFLFAALFLAILVATHLVVLYLGDAGVYGLAGLMGLTDVDPFIMGMTQTSGGATPASVAAAAVAVAAASNNVAKGAYAWTFAERETGRPALLLLLALAVLGLAPLLTLSLR